MNKKLDAHLCRAVGDLGGAIKVAHLMNDAELYEELYQLRKKIGKIRDDCAEKKD